jgi:hypothetical protein
MAIYRFRLIDRHGEVIAVFFLSVVSDADAKRQADTMLVEYDCERVEVWTRDKLVYAAMRRVT